MRESLCPWNSSAPSAIGRTGIREPGNWSCENSARSPSLLIPASHPQQNGCPKLPSAEVPKLLAHPFDAGTLLSLSVESFCSFAYDTARSLSISITTNMQFVGKSTDAACIFRFDTRHPPAVRLNRRNLANVWETEFGYPASEGAASYLGSGH